MVQKIQLRRGTAAEWTASNPALLAGEEGYESDTGKRKVGPGNWNSLPYATSPGVSGVAVTGTPSTGQVLTATSTSAAAWSSPSAGAGDATAGAKGVVQLGGDLAGTAAAPTVPGLAGKADAAATTTALAGKAAVDLSNVTAATGRTALGLGTAAVRGVGTSSGTVAAGDDARIGAINGVTVTGTPSAGQVPTASSGSAAAWATPASAPPADGSITTAKLGSSVPSDLATNAAFTGTYATGVTLGSVTGATATDKLNAAISAAASLYGNRAFVDLQGSSIAITGVTLGSYTKLRNGRITRSGTGTGPLLTIPEQAQLQTTDQLVLEDLDIDGVTTPTGTTPNGSVGLLILNHAAAILNNVNIRRCDTGISITGAQFCAAWRVKTWDCNVGLYLEARAAGGGGNSWSWYDFQAIGCQVGVVMNNLFDGPQAANFFRNPSILDSKICAAAFFGVSQTLVDGGANEYTASSGGAATYTYAPPTGAASLTVKRSSFYLNASNVEVNGFSAEAQVNPGILAENGSTIVTGDFGGYGASRSLITDATSRWTLGGQYACGGSAGTASSVSGAFVSRDACLVGPPTLTSTDKLPNQVSAPQVPTFFNQLGIASESTGTDSTYGAYRAITFNAVVGDQSGNRVMTATPTVTGATCMAVAILVQASVNTSLRVGLNGNIGNQIVDLAAGRWQRILWTKSGLTGGTTYSLNINETSGAGATVKFACVHLFTAPATPVFDAAIDALAKGAHNPLAVDSAGQFAPAAGMSQTASLARVQKKLAAITTAPPARLRWLTYGDSYAQKIYAQIWTTLASMAGGPAGAYGTHTNGIVGGITINGTTGTITSDGADFTRWPTGGGEVYATGATRTYGAGGSTFTADTIKIYYAKEPGAGTFKIQVDGADASGFTNINAAGTLGQLGIATVTVAAGPHTVTVVNLTGTHTLLAIGYELSTASGLVSINVSQGGIALNSATSTAYSNFQAFLTDVQPDIMTLEVKENSSYLPAALAALYGITAAGAPGMDVLAIGSTPVSTGDGDQVIQNSQMRTATVAAGYRYWDSYAPFGSYQKLVDLGWQGDGIHVDVAADQFRGMLMLRDTGLLDSYGRTVQQGGPRLPKVTVGKVGEAFAVGLLQPEQTFGLDLEVRTNRRVSFKTMAGTEGACLDLGGASQSWMPDKLRIGAATGPAFWALGPTRIAVMRGDNLTKTADVQAKTFVMDSALANTSGTVTLDLSDACAYQLALTGNVTSLAFSNAPASGAMVEIHFVQDATGSRTLAGVNSAIKFAGGTVPTLTTTAAKRDIFTFRQVPGPIWVEVSRSMNVG